LLTIVVDLLYTGPIFMILLQTLAHGNVIVKKKHNNVFYSYHWFYKYKQQNSYGGNGHD
jgi:hypothetical protein